MNLIAEWGSRELYVIAVTAIGLGVAFVTGSMGLSFAFGAFVAGMVISESPHSHQALGDIIPLRDVFSLLFFASAGLLFDPGFVVSHKEQVATAVVVVSVGKGLILASVVRLFGYRNVVPLAAGLTLFSVGEIGLVLARVGLTSGAFDHDVYSLMLATAIITMVVTPAVSAATGPIYALFRKWRPATVVETGDLPEVELRDHAIVAGGGRVGQQIAHVLQRAGVPFVVIELGHRRAEDCRQQGFPLIFGDAANMPVLEAAGLQSARLLIAAIPASSVTHRLVALARMRRPDLRLIVRAADLEELRALRAQRVDSIVQPELEASITMIREGLEHLGMDVEVIETVIDDFRDGVEADG